jgi:hypothetical protein
MSANPATGIENSIARLYLYLIKIDSKHLSFLYKYQLFFALRVAR